MSTVVNTKNLEPTDITGSLLQIEIPSEKIFQSGVRKTIKSTIVNAINLQTIDITGSLQNIIEPVKPVNSNTRSQISTPTITNTDKIVLDFREDIFKYSARNIEKTITSFDAQTNQLFISGTIIDYGTEAVSDKDFEIYYNGVRLPDIFMVKQINNDIVITLTEEYIQYDDLRLSEIKVIGKFI
jgi:hypothetical protein